MNRGLAIGRGAPARLQAHHHLRHHGCGEVRQAETLCQRRQPRPLEGGLGRAGGTRCETRWGLPVVLTGGLAGLAIFVAMFGPIHSNTNGEPKTVWKMFYVFIIFHL